MRIWTGLWQGVKRMGYLVRAAGWATVLGVIETIQSRRGRRVLAVVALAGIALLVWTLDPIRTVDPGQVGVRINKLTGNVSELREGWAIAVPGLHRIRTYPLRDQIYSPRKAATASGEAPFQSVEGLSVGVEVTVRYAFDSSAVTEIALKLPDNVGDELIKPVVDGVLYRTFAKHTVREIFSKDRSKIEDAIEADLVAGLKRDGILIRDVFIGSVDLPADYRRGLESLLSEELEAEKMRYTLELKEKKIKESELEAKAEKVRREQGAEAAAREQIIAAQARAEAMQHILPLKKKEIDQRRLEAEASKVHRIKLAEGSAQARRIEASGEADSRRTLADAEAYRIDVTGKKRTEQLARDSLLIAKNPLLIQKTVADKLSDNIRVIIAPPEAGGFFASGLLGGQK